MDAWFVGGTVALFLGTLIWMEYSRRRNLKLIDQELGLRHKIEVDQTSLKTFLVKDTKTPSLRQFCIQLSILLTQKTGLRVVFTEAIGCKYTLECFEGDRIVGTLTISFTLGGVLVESDTTAINLKKIYDVSQGLGDSLTPCAS